ncbi:PRC-barrel domain-containing protein [Desertibaculum subflavum]|uniref:PRC-barrel domain-containing protein n=1 Tax=Desertibaculum subflavum TaxID=2268458 RepID=UPI0013C48289
MRQNRMATLAAVILLSGAGAAYAAGSGTKDNPGNTVTPQAGGAVKNPPGAESARENAVKPKLGQWAVGKTVYDRAGDAVGTVKRVDGDRLVVSAGADLGIGSREIILNANQLNQSGSGADMRLITTLTKAQLKQQPDAKSDMNSTGKKQ